MPAGDIVYQVFAYGVPVLIVVGIATFTIKKYKNKGQTD